MRGYLLDTAGDTYILPELLQWSLTYTDGVPCDSYEIQCVFEEPLGELLQQAVEFYAVHAGATVFRGVVDEYEICADAGGRTASITGRGFAARLLDNEAEAQTYVSCTIDDILDRHVRPWGVRDIEIGPMPAVSGLQIESGTSQWDVLCSFCRMSSGIAPRFTRTGTLMLSDAYGETYSIRDWNGAYGLQYRRRRYGVLSEVLVKNSGTGRTQLVQDSEFIAEGGLCRRVLSMPRRTEDAAMRAAGEYQLQKAKSRRSVCSLRLPTLFAAFPRDIIVLQQPLIDISGTYMVCEAICWANASGAGTHLEMVPKEEI